MLFSFHSLLQSLSIGRLANLYATPLLRPPFALHSTAKFQTFSVDCWVVRCSRPDFMIKILNDLPKDILNNTRMKWTKYVHKNWTELKAAEKRRRRRRRRRDRDGNREWGYKVYMNVWPRSTVNDNAFHNVQMCINHRPFRFIHLFICHFPI